MKESSLWFQEKLYNDIALTVRTKKTVVPPYWTGFQKLAIYDTEALGRMLVLDDVIQLCEKDEALYHELMAHWSLYAHPEPKRVLIVGGGDGGVAREVLKHSTVTSLTVVDIDPEVTLQVSKHMPSIGQRFHSNPITHLLHQDALKHLSGKKDEYDVIIVDSTDDIGVASALFEKNFLHQLHQALTSHGIMMFCVGGSLFLQSEELKKNIKKCSDIFGKSSVQPIFTGTASYLGGYFGSIAAFRDARDCARNIQIASERFTTCPINDLKWYSPSMHRSVTLRTPSILD